MVGLHHDPAARPDSFPQRSEQSQILLLCSISERSEDIARDIALVRERRLCRCLA